MAKVGKWSSRLEKLYINTDHLPFTFDSTIWVQPGWANGCSNSPSLTQHCGDRSVFFQHFVQLLILNNPSYKSAQIRLWHELKIFEERPQKSTSGSKKTDADMTDKNPLKSEIIMHTHTHKHTQIYSSKTNTGFFWCPVVNISILSTTHRAGRITWQIPLRILVPRGGGGVHLNKHYNSLHGD